MTFSFGFARVTISRSGLLRWEVGVSELLEIGGTAEIVFSSRLPNAFVAGAVWGSVASLLAASVVVSSCGWVC